MEEYTTYTSTNADGPRLSAVDLIALTERLRRVVICTAIWFIDSPIAYYRMRDRIAITRGASALDTRVCPRLEDIPVYTWGSRLWTEGDPEPPTRDAGVWILMSDGSRRLLVGY